MPLCVCMISRGGAELLFNYLANMILGVVVPIRDRSCSFIKSSIVSLLHIIFSLRTGAAYARMEILRLLHRDVYKDAHLSRAPPRIMTQRRPCPQNS